MKERAATSNQSAAGAAKGRRSHARSDSTTTTTAHTENHKAERGAFAESCSTTTSIAPAAAARTIKTSKPYRRVTYATWPTQPR
jgi:hypothetical protein